MSPRSTDPTSGRSAEPGEPGPALSTVDCAAALSARRIPALAVAPCPLPTTTAAQAGAGVRIALLGGQVDVGHPDLWGADVRLWPRTAVVPPDPTGRATALASLLVGQGERHVRGLVPGAELLAACVLTDDGAADELIAQAVRWAVAEGADVVVVPFGRRRLGRRVATTLRAAVAAGVRVIAAAGDLGPELLAFPGSVSGVVAVTGYDDDGVLPRCSARADLAAPGRDVPAAGPDGVVLLQGSAPAAVLAAGVCAALLADVFPGPLRLVGRPTRSGRGVDGRRGPVGPTARRQTRPLDGSGGRPEGGSDGGSGPGLGSGTAGADGAARGSARSDEGLPRRGTLRGVPELRVG